jgi:23S rRNA pseudouridine2605 synthase
MRLNQYIAHATDMSRRAADQVISAGRVKVNNLTPDLGVRVGPNDVVTLDSRVITPSVKTTTILLNKPVGYVCSKDGQGSQTIYDLLPPELKHLNPAGRLDKDSSGLVILTDDGQLLNQLTHPSFNKEKLYEITLNRPLTNDDFKSITQTGVDIGDSRQSIFMLYRISDFELRACLTEGRNRQIRRTFSALNYTVKKLHRTQVGDFKLDDLADGKFKTIHTP